MPEGSKEPAGFGKSWAACDCCRHFSATECHSPYHVSARRTHVDLMLNDRLLHGVVPKRVNQQHLIVSPTGQALHHSPHVRPARIVSREGASGGCRFSKGAVRTCG